MVHSYHEKSDGFHKTPIYWTENMHHSLAVGGTFMSIFWVGLHSPRDWACWELVKFYIQTGTEAQRGNCDLPKVTQLETAQSKLELLKDHEPCTCAMLPLQ